MSNSKQLLTTGFCLAILIISAFYLLLTTAGDGVLASAESDQILYMQYARNMANGHPFVFSAGNGPCSGSTTYLYIPLLALFYHLGATGESFFVVSYLLNALFYLGIVLAVFQIAKKMNPRSVPLALLLTVLSGHTVSAVLKQTDIGLFMLLTMTLMAALLHTHYTTALLLTMLCAAARPEGFLFSFAFLTCAAGGWVMNRRSGECTKEACRQVRWFLILGTAGTAVFLLTLLVNHHYTGYFQFMSVANKGYLKSYALSGAVVLTLQDALSLLKGVFFGLQESNRQFYLLPLISGVLGVAGILLYDRKDKIVRRVECWLALITSATLLLVASSKFEGLSNDRYLGWILPVWIVYVAIGWDAIGNRIKAHYFKPVCATFLILFQFASLSFIAASAYPRAVSLEHEKQLGIRAGETFSPSSRFGSTLGGRIAFFMPHHSFYNLSGISSPDFFTPGNTHAHPIVEILKHRPEIRFDYWITSEQYLDDHPWIRPLVGDLVMLDMDTALTTKAAFGIYRAEWSSLDGGLEPCLVSQQIKSLKLADRLEIGLIDDERAHDYQVETRIKATKLTPTAMTARLGDNDYTEIGRIVMGAESFTISNINQSKPLTVVLRTGARAGGGVLFGQQYSSINKLEFDEAISLRLFVYDREVPCPPVTLLKEGYSEVLFEIPAEYLLSNSPKLRFVGDHISYTYWFYQ